MIQLFVIQSTSYSANSLIYECGIDGERASDSEREGAARKTSCSSEPNGSMVSRKALTAIY